jgi:predicted nucleic acid-binding protein
VRLFLDTSVLLAACGSTTGASHEIFRQARAHSWTLIATPYVIGEVLNNLADFPPSAAAQWANLRAHLLVLDDVLTLDRPALFTAGKDRPILFSALAWADVLLTRDIGDFGEILGGSFYELLVMTPGDFLQCERSAGRL